MPFAKCSAPVAIALATAPPYSSTFGATAVQYAAASTSLRTLFSKSLVPTTEWTEKLVYAARMPSRRWSGWESVRP
uniref:Uncharacterized protein n=1 Tax=Arundo donax TaxID=35708 RepID=A0A0A9CUE7_ARUDO